MAKDIRALYVYTNVAASPGDKDAGIRALYVYTNVAAAPTKDIRALFVFTNVAAAPPVKAIRALFVYTNVARISDVNDGVEVQLLDASLEVEHILRGRLQ